MRGGLGARTQVLDIEDAAGARSKVVLRVYLPGRTTLTPDRARREFRTIELVQSAGVPSPRPLYLDAEGEYLGEPAMLLSYLPGRSMYQPRGVNVWVRELAQAMHAIHAVTPDRHDLSWLPRRGREELAAELEGMRERVDAHEDGIAREAFAALEANQDRIAWVEPCLIHEDFWPGNTVWFRGRLTGVIDWANACLGDPRLDPAQCCIDSHLVNGAGVSEALRDAYAALASRAVPDQWYFDLYVGLRGLLEYEIWLIGYHDAGLTFVTTELARERVHDFMRRALDAGAKGAS
ncbi:MAG TPA: phosphotransferase [Candidatus Krumholzibacteria bacterium]